MAGLTVIFSTYNGAFTLPRMLDALEQLEAPPGGWKLVAVDNASTDNSAALLHERAGRLPMAVVREPRRGKSSGLNAGLALAEGDLVVFTDDDVVPRRDWLVAFRRLVDAQPDFDVFGGAIYPIWPSPPPDWLLRCVPRWFFAWTDFEDGPIGPGDVWGPNMAVRRKALGGRRYFEGIGPNGEGSYAAGEETELLERAARDGLRSWHSTGVVVGHLVKPRQMTPRWLLQRAYNHARGRRRLWSACDEPVSRHVVGRPRSLMSRCVRGVVLVATATFASDFEQRFMASKRLREIEADLAERLYQWRHARR